MEQGTQEWRKARVGKITASRIGIILGNSPFSKPDALLREMVREANGIFEELNAPPVRWGNDHEDDAAEQFGYFYGAGSDMAPGGFFEDGILAVSPDRLINTDAVLEIKCPYAIRKDKDPEFKRLADQPHYMDQVQMQMMVTGRHTAHFYQWTPEGDHYEIVHYDPEWWERAKPAVEEFHARYLAALEKPDEYLKESSVYRNDDAWKAAGDEFKKAYAAHKEAEKALNAAKAKIKKLADGVSSYGDGFFLSVEDRMGAVDYKKIVEEKLPEVDVEEYRKAGSSITKIGVKK